MGGASAFAVMVGVAASCGLAIALAYQATAGRIEENRARRLEQSVALVVPGTVSSRGYRLGPDTAEATDLADADAIAALDAEGRLLGVALTAQVMGYQDSIRLLLGYDPAGEQLTGLAVLESRETPGLGSRIGTDRRFLASLRGLDVRLAKDGLTRPVTLASGTGERRAWQLDGITGATVSSSAVVRAINEAAPVYAAVRAHLSAMTGDRGDRGGRADAG